MASQNVSQTVSQTVSQKKLDANRRNAAKSTGPKTEEGKAAASQNAVKHGLLSKFCPILPGEDEAEYNAFHAEMVRDLHPRGILQRQFTDAITQISWKLRRVPMIEAAQIERTQHYIANCNCDFRQCDVPKEIQTIWILAREFTGTRGGFANLELYRSRLERSLHAALRELRKLREETGAEEEKVCEKCEQSQRDTGLRPVQEDVEAEGTVIAEESSEHGPEAHVTEPHVTRVGTNEATDAHNHFTANELPSYPSQPESLSNPDSAHISGRSKP